MDTAVLRIQFADGRVEERTLSPGSYDIGRDSGHITLGDTNVSGQHARIEVRPGQVVITDLGSTNGTYDGRGQRLVGPYPITQNETIRLGSCSIQWLPARPLAGGTQVMGQMAPLAAPGPHPVQPHQPGQFGGAPPHALPHHGPAGFSPSAGGPPHGFQPPPQQAWSAPQFGQPPQVPMNLATWGQRALGYLIDYAIVMVVMGILYALAAGLLTGAATLSSAASPDAAAGIMSSGCCLAAVLVPASMLLVGLFNRVYLVSKRGASIGQGVMNLRVVDAQGNLLSMGTALLRLLVHVLLASLQLGAVIDLLWPLWDDRRQTLHDKAVNCFVIYVPNV